MIGFYHLPHSIDEQFNYYFFGHDTKNTGKTEKVAEFELHKNLKLLCNKGQINRVKRQPAK
jgi:hypothetical protein